jgi:hypothetical protein
VIGVENVLIHGMSDCVRPPASRKLAWIRLMRPLQTPASRMLSRDWGSGEYHVRRTEEQEMLASSTTADRSQSLRSATLPSGCLR